eukprot:3940481-Rhodomonas_salina.2
MIGRSLYGGGGWGTGYVSTGHRIGGCYHIAYASTGHRTANCTLCQYPPARAHTRPLHPSCRHIA